MSARLYLVIIAVLVAIIGLMAYKFVVVGSVKVAESGRTAVLLEPSERELVLREMRGFIVGLQAITDALVRGDAAAVARASRSMGMRRSHDAPASMLGKLPLPFKTLAFGLHQEFDAIAADAERNRPPAQTLAQLANALQKCVACHATYEIASSSAR